MSSSRRELNKWLFTCNLNVVSWGTNARRQKQCPGGANNLLNDSYSFTQNMWMKDDHQQDFINERHESLKRGFALLSPKFYRTADTLTASLNRSFPDRNDLHDELCRVLCCAFSKEPGSVIFVAPRRAEIFNWFLPEFSLPWADETPFPQFVFMHPVLTPRPPQWSSAVPSTVCQGLSFIGEPTAERNILQIVPWVPRKIRIPSVDLLVLLLLVQCNVWLAFVIAVTLRRWHLAAVTRWWLACSLSSRKSRLSLAELTSPASPSTQLNLTKKRQMKILFLLLLLCLSKCTNRRPGSRFVSLGTWEKSITEWLFRTFRKPRLLLCPWDAGRIDQCVWENREVGLMSWNTSCRTRELCSRQGSCVLCSPELMSENLAGRSSAVPGRAAVWGVCCPNWAGQRGVMLLLPVVPSLGVCVYQVSRAITESRIPKSHYYNSFLFACVQSWQCKMVPP